MAADWRRAVLRIDETGHREFWLGEILKSDPRLAHDWLRRRAHHRPVWPSLTTNQTLKGAVAGLDRDGRRCILLLGPSGHWAEQLVAALVEDDVALYRLLLSRDDLARFHLAPLAGQPVSSWVDKARIALEAGIPPERVAVAAYLGPDIYTGNGSDHSADWADQFAALMSSDHDGLRRVGDAGRRMAEEQRQRHLKQERHEAIYGAG